MIITVASFKGGVGKTVTAIHLAAYLAGYSSKNKNDSSAKNSKVLLVDGDLNRSALQWARAGDGLPYQVCDEDEAIKLGRSADHIVIDTAARPTADELASLARGCDLLVVPTKPDALSMGAMMQMTSLLAGSNYKVLLTITPPAPSRSADDARGALSRAGVPLFDSEIRRLDAFNKAALAGCVVAEVKSDRNAANAWDCYQKVGEEITNE